MVPRDGGLQGEDPMSSVPPYQRPEQTYGA
ncbi:MAG: hypothetical protein QOE15_3110, partial [Acidimicrobiaceae bacterium]|nr:hypothetical protein [Acidimicrobiaceae bacterium]